MDGCHFGDDWLLQSQQPQNHATITFIRCIRTQLYGPEDDLMCLTTVQPLFAVKLALCHSSVLLSELDLRAPLALEKRTTKEQKKKKKQQMGDRS